MRKLVFFLTLILLFPIEVFAQKQAITVKSFQLDENNLTANANPVYDQTNQKCALIIVSNIGSDDYRFDVGNAFSKVEKKEMNGKPVYLLWVSEGTRKLSIYSGDSEILPLQNYSFNSPIKKAKTYHMELGEILKSSKSSKQYLTFEISPVVPGVAIEVDEVPWTITNGRASNLVNAGEHTYRISAPEYNTAAGIVTTLKTDGNKDVKINLVPIFGWLDIDGGTMMNDAEVFIDARSIGKGNIQHHKLSSGTYVVKIVKPHYKLFQSNVIIKDGESAVVKPRFVNDASDVTINVAKDASIYLDNAYLGAGSWTGPLEIGQYIVEARLQNHHTVSQTISVPQIDQKYTFKLKDNEAILTELSIESEPVGAKISIDGKYIGITPYHINDIIIGKHQLVVSKDGYNNYDQEITLTEHNDNKVVAHLDNLAKIRIESTPSRSSLYINSRYVGTTPYESEYDKGTKLNIELRHDGCNDFKTSFVATGSMTKNYELGINESCFINGSGGGMVYVDGRYVGRVPYRLTGENGTKHKVKIKWSGERMKTRSKTITLGKDRSFYGIAEQHRNRGRQVANIIWTCCLPSFGWLSWILNPVNEP